MILNVLKKCHLIILLLGSTTIIFSQDAIPWIVGDRNEQNLFYKIGIGMEIGNHTERYYLISEANIYLINNLNWSRENNSFIDSRMRQKLSLINKFYFNYRIFNNKFIPFNRNRESYSIITTLTINQAFFSNQSIYSLNNNQVLSKDAWRRSGFDLEFGLFNSVHTDGLRKLSNLQFILGMGVVNKADQYHLGFRFIEDIILIPQLAQLSHDHGETTTWNLFATFRDKSLDFRQSRTFGFNWITKMITDRRDRLDIVRPHPKHANGLYNTLMTSHPEHGNRTLEIFHHYRTMNFHFQSNYHTLGLAVGHDNMRYGMKEQRWGHQGQQHKRRSNRKAFWGKHKSPTLESALFPWLNVERYYTKKPFNFELNYSLTTFNATEI